MGARDKDGRGLGADPAVHFSGQPSFSLFGNVFFNNFLSKHKLGKLIRLIIEINLTLKADFVPLL